MNILFSIVPVPILKILFIGTCFLFISTGIMLSQQDHPKYKEAKRLQSQVDYYEKDNKENVELLSKSLELFSEIGAWKEYIDCQTTLGIVYYIEKDYDNFFSLVSDMVELSNKYLDPLSVDYSLVLLFLALRYELSGNVKKSIELQRKSIEITINAIKLDESENIDKHSLLRTFEGLGVSYQLLGDFDEAINNYQQALKYGSNIENEGHHEISRLSRQIGFCYLKKRQLQKALRLYHKSISIQNKLPKVPFYLQTSWYLYQDLADLYFQNNQQDSALYFINIALNIQKKTSPLEAYKSYVQLGNIHLESKSYDETLEAYNAAYDIAKKEYSSFEKHPSFGICVSKIASVYSEKNDYSNSLSYFQEALKLSALNFNANNYSKNPTAEQFIIKRDGLDVLAEKADVLYHLYKKENKQADLIASYETYQSATELIRAIRQDYLADGSKHTLAEKVIPIYEKAIEVSLELNRITGEGQYLENAFSFAESNKAVLLFESIKNDMAKGIAGIPDNLLGLERELSSNLAFYQKLIKEEQQKGSDIDEGKINGWEKLVYENNESHQRLIDKLETEYPSYFELKYKRQEISIANIQSKLPDQNSALVEYMIGEKNGYIFSITKNDFTVFKIKEKEQLFENIAQLRSLINNPPNSGKFGQDFLKFTDLSNNIYEQILAEPVDKMPDNIQRLVIIPDDVLCYLPFEVLLTKKPKNIKPNYSLKNLDYLFEKYALHYQYSASLMTAGKKVNTEKIPLNNFIGFAPNFEGSYAAARTCSDDQLYSLQCNEQEVNTISQLMKGDALIAASAGLDHFLQNASTYRILHLATHACVDDSDVGLNKIYLADGNLSQYELSNLKLNAELTVLSACNTGMGKLLRGEGMMSLTRSFMLAGSKGVLTSLWSVDDCATSDIMVNYYQGLKKGWTKDKAVGEAKMAYLRNADRNNSHPYYWGAFVQFGEVGALENMGGRFYYWLVAGAGIVLLIGYLFFSGQKTG